jgi:glycosyltransferase involved in cell wall biosynthesis
MKLLYIGVYRDSTGWSHATINNILALSAVGVDVIPRPIKLNASEPKLPDKLKELEVKSSAGSDIVIQHILPHMMDYNGRFKKNIGVYYNETSHFRSSNWPDRLNLMDELWLTSNYMLSSARASSVETNASIVPCCVDVHKFEKSYRQLALPEAEGNFKFYTIGEAHRRKNLAALIKAFHLEFSPEEPVSLVIKTSKSGLSAGECKVETEGFCRGIKDGLKLYADESFYKKEVIITDNITEDSMCRLHSSCDCFVSPSYGEGWCLPALDALGFGKTPIVTNWSAFPDYINNNTGWLVNYHLEPVFGMTETFADLYTGQEEWAAVSIQHLRRCMREAYENVELRKNKSEAGTDKVYDFSYENVGKLMKGLLESYV